MCCEVYHFYMIWQKIFLYAWKNNNNININNFFIIMIFLKIYNNNNNNIFFLIIIIKPVKKNIGYLWKLWTSQKCVNYYADFKQVVITYCFAIIIIIIIYHTTLGELSFLLTWIQKCWLLFGDFEQVKKCWLFLVIFGK